jgi:hypothetical protein
MQELYKNLCWQRSDFKDLSNILWETLTHAAKKFFTASE